MSQPPTAREDGQGEGQDSARDPREEVGCRQKLGERAAPERGLQHVNLEQERGLLRERQADRPQPDEIQTAPDDAWWEVASSWCTQHDKAPDHAAHGERETQQPETAEEAGEEAREGEEHPALEDRRKGARSERPAARAQWPIGRSAPLSVRPDRGIARQVLVFSDIRGRHG